MTDTNRSTITLQPADGSSGGVNFCGQCKKHFVSATELERHLADPSHVLEKLIRCKTCGMYFQSEARLEAHNRTHFIDNTNNSKKHHCNYCEKSFSLPSQLKRHERRHKSDPKCNQCDETFVTRAQLHHHEQTHSSQKESYKCRFCDKCFVSSSKFRVHEKYHTNVRAHKCAYCDKAFSSPSQLQNHERYHTGERPYKCDQCGKGFVTATVLGYHKQSHNNQAKRYKCASCQKSFVVASQLRIHERVRHTGERPFKCVHCDKAYPSHSQLQKHKQFHTGVRIGSRASVEKQFKCRCCDHDFTSARCLERHIQSTHAKTVQEDTNRNFDCTYCNEGFGDRSSLEMHLIRHHADKKPHKCDECGLMCATISGLHSHERVHLKQTFRCLQCDKTFWTKNRFQLHEKTCSGLHIVEKQHKCSHCNKTFEYLGTLRNHQRIHSPAQVEEQFKCSHCDRVYSKAKYLKRHIQRLEQKPRECIHCHKIFKNQICLTEHSYIHDPEKHQKCSYCDCLFTVKSLRRHLKNFNGSCKKSFTNLTRFAEQQRSHTPLTTHELSNEMNCSHCGKGFGSLALLKLHERLHTGERPFKCCTCEAGFRSRLYLELHSVVHDDGKRNLDGHPFRCEQCDKSFKGHILLKFHMRRAHFTEKRFKCTYCHAAFLSAAHLGKHRRCHLEPGIKPYKLVNEPGSTYNATRPRKCPECGKIVVSHFKTHMNVHLGIKPYKCKECEECFARSDALRKHERLHTGEKQYQCTVCGKCVTLTGYLVEDKRIHTGEMKCTQCESSFSGVDELTKYVESQAAQLTEHIKKHFKCNLGENSLPLESSFEQGALQDNSVGETPYSCTDCNESFGTSSGFKLHKQTGHCSGKAAHKCTDCDKSFSFEDELKKHMEIHSQEEPHRNTNCQEEPHRNTNCQKETHSSTYCQEEPHRNTNCQEEPHSSTYCQEEPHSSTNCQEEPHRNTNCQEEHHRCTNRGLVFQEAVQLAEHLENTSDCCHGEKSEQSFQKSVKWYNSEGSFKCDMCGKCFSLLQNLSSHKIKHLEKASLQTCSPLNTNFSTQLEVNIQDNSPTRSLQDPS